jgi:hypothetical protein
MVLTSMMQVFLAGFLGGLVLEIVHWYNIRKDGKWPTYAGSINYWVISGLMANSWRGPSCSLLWKPRGRTGRVTCWIICAPYFAEAHYDSGQARREEHDGDPIFFQLVKGRDRYALCLSVSRRGEYIDSRYRSSDMRLRYAASDAEAFSRYAAAISNDVSASSEFHHLLVALYRRARSKMPFHVVKPRREPAATRLAI